MIITNDSDHIVMLTRIIAQTSEPGSYETPMNRSVAPHEDAVAPLSLLTTASGRRFQAADYAPTHVVIDGMVDTEARSITVTFRR